VDKLVEMARAVTGWNASTWGLLKAAERTSVMLRLFNNREGFTSRDDTLPKRLLEAVPTGPLSGKNKIDEQLFGELIKLYYQMAGWDEDGKPTAAKL